jgi:hypothetical protein
MLQSIGKVNLSIVVICMAKTSNQQGLQNVYNAKIVRIMKLLLKK